MRAGMRSSGRRRPAAPAPACSPRATRRRNAGSPRRTLCASSTHGRWSSQLAFCHTGGRHTRRAWDGAMAMTRWRGACGPRRGRRAPSRHVAAVVASLTLVVVGLAGCNLPTGFHDYVVFDGLDRPTAIEFSPDGRIFVAEKRGVVKVFDDATDRTPTVAADLRTNVYNSWDRGLLAWPCTPTFPPRPTSSSRTPTTPSRAATPPGGGNPGSTATSAPRRPGRTTTAASSGPACRGCGSTGTTAR